jgi:stage II sporulation protein D
MRAVKALGAVGLGAVVAASGLAAVPASAGQVYYVPVTNELTVRGHGYGHGHGMSQYGAEGAARQGRSYQEILAHYYPGTSLGRMRGKIRVLVTADTTSDVKVSPARGLSVRDRADGGSWELPTSDRIDRWRILANGRVQMYRSGGWRRWDIPGPRTTLRGEGEFFAARPITLWVGSGGSEVARRYRGALRSAAVPGSKDHNTVNVLKMDSYLRGVVPAEMPASWSLEALKSQAVAARTYAARDREANSGRYYHTCDTTSCQVYGGASSEYASTNRAVRQTARQILRYHGEPAFTQFSSSSGGYTSYGGYPYLPAKRDPWDGWSGNYVHSWQTTIKPGVLEARYPSLGRLLAINVVARDGHGQWGGRVLRLRLDGRRSDVTITGDDLRWAYELRSTWFTIEDTVIMRKWRRIGAAKSPVGRPAGPEQPREGVGAMQRFETGRIYWSRRTGARELYGRIAREYRSIGAAGSSIGYPRTGVIDLGRKRRKSIFQRGAIYHTPPTGAHVLTRGWRRAYRKAGLEDGRLGFPTSDVYRAGRAQRMDFQDGAIVRRRDGRFEVRYS